MRDAQGADNEADHPDDKTVEAEAAAEEPVAPLPAPTPRKHRGGILVVDDMPDEPEPPMPSPAAAGKKGGSVAGGADAKKGKKK